MTSNFGDSSLKSRDFIHFHNSSPFSGVDIFAFSYVWCQLKILVNIKNLVTQLTLLDTFKEN